MHDGIVDHLAVYLDRRLALRLGRIVGGQLPGVNDGVVCVEETAVEGMAASKLVRESHSWMPVSAGVARLAETFMSTGRFE